MGWLGREYVSDHVPLSWPVGFVILPCDVLEYWVWTFAQLLPPTPLKKFWTYVFSPYVSLVQPQ